MKAQKLAEILLQNPDLEVVIRCSGYASPIYTPNILAWVAEGVNVGSNEPVYLNKAIILE